MVVVSIQKAGIFLCMKPVEAKEGVELQRALANEVNGMVRALINLEYLPRDEKTFFP